MPIRWVVCPVVTIQPVNVAGDPVGQPYRAPKFKIYQDPGQPLITGTDPDTGLPFSHRKEYAHTSVVYAANFCLSILLGIDFTPIDADAEITTVIDDAGIDLGLTPRDLGINQGRFNSIMNRLANHGVDITGLTLDTPVEDILIRIASTIKPGFTKVRSMRVT